MFAINERSEVNINRNQSINQSNESHLVKNPDSQVLIQCHTKLKKEIYETEQLINTKLEIKTIEEFDNIIIKITKLGFKTV